MKTKFEGTPADQCKGIPRPGCKYTAPCGQSCNKCGQVHHAHLLTIPPVLTDYGNTRALIEECKKALAEELAAWDIDPPLHHVKQAHDRCSAWLKSHPAPDPDKSPYLQTR